MDTSQLHTAGPFPICVPHWDMCRVLLSCSSGWQQAPPSHFLNDTLVSQLPSLKKMSEVWAIKICLGAHFYEFQAVIRPKYTLFAGLWLGLPNQSRLVWGRKRLTLWWEADKSQMNQHPSISVKVTCQWPKDLLLDLEDGSSGEDN